MERGRENGGVDLSGETSRFGTGVEFEEQYGAPHSFYSQPPKIVQWAMLHSRGFIKDERQANYALIGFAVAAIIISLVITFGGGKEKQGFDMMPPAEIMGG